MLLRKMIFSLVLIAIVSTNPARAERDYTYVVTVGQDPNAGYDCNTINAAVLQMMEYAPNEVNLGCIEVYDGNYVEHLNDYYYDSNDLPAHCD